MNDMKLGCSSCTRRQVLHGIGIGVAGSLVAACGGGGGDQGTVDAAPPDAPACPTGDLCLDDTKSPYTALANTNGFAIVSASVGKLVVVRQSATAAAALSAICTHQGCTVTYLPSTQRLHCPCHGAEFSLTGSVLAGPATVALKSYSTMVVGTMIDIKLA